MTSQVKTDKNKSIFFTELALLSAILVILSFTPLGSIPLPLVKATTSHIPVIIGAVILGPEAGLILGGLFGVVSVLRSTIMPGITAFCFSPFIPVPGTDSGSFWALIVAFVPRILVGLFPALLIGWLAKRKVNSKVSYVICAAAGSLTNTVLVLALIYVFFGQAYAAALSIDPAVLIGSLLTVVATNGVGELIVAVILVPAIAIPLSKIKVK